MNPPRTGAKMGVQDQIIATKEKALTSSSPENTSRNEALNSTLIVAQPDPCKNRAIKNVSMFFENIQKMLENKKSETPKMNIGRRPKRSERGPTMICGKLEPSKSAVKLSCVIDADV